MGVADQVEVAELQVERIQLQLHVAWAGDADPAAVQHLNSARVDGVVVRMLGVCLDYGSVFSRPGLRYGDQLFRTSFSADEESRLRAVQQNLCAMKQTTEKRAEKSTWPDHKEISSEAGAAPGPTTVIERVAPPSTVGRDT